MRTCRALLVVGAAFAAWGCGSSSSLDVVHESAVSGVPDYAITAVRAAPSAAPGAVFGVTTTVCNAGGVSAPPTSVELVVSADAAIDVEDALIGWASVPGLQPQQCDTQVMQVAYGGTGAFYLGAIVDPSDSVAEDSESNNRLGGGMIGIGVAPDLVVASVSGPPSAGGLFRLASSVCNQGTDASHAATLWFYASTDPTITGVSEDPATADILFAARSVGSLQPGQCDAESIDVFPPWLASGAYYLGAIIDETGEVPELIESNNHATGTLIGLGLGPDLVATAVSGPASASGQFQITFSLCNQGTQFSSGTDVRFYASSDATITGLVDDPSSPDWFLGSLPIDGLSAGQCGTATFDASAPPVTGALYLGAIVDEAHGVPELIESNNHTTGALIGVGNGPDLVVTSVAGPPSASGSFQIASTVCNQGTQPSSGTDLRFYASADPAITGFVENPFTPDAVLGVRFVGSLAPGQCDTASADAFAPGGPPGAFYLGAIVDEGGGVPELIESNNHATGALIGLGYGPDLVVASVTGPPSADGAFQVATTVCNHGTQASPGATLQLYASSDTTITGFVENPFASDFLLNWGFVGWLAPGQCSVVSTSAFAPWGATGAFYLGAIVDEIGQVPELIESNNHATGALIGLGNGPDLVVTAISGPPSASGAFQITTTVCNQGTQASSGGVELYASADPTITGLFDSPFAPDFFLGFRSVVGLQPGQCDTASTDVLQPMAGAFYLGAIVRADTTELIASNNHTTGALIGLGLLPDLVVTSVTGPPSASGAFQITTTVCNQGTQPSSGTDVRLYASADATITGSTESPFASDTVLGSRFVGPLSPGQCDAASADAFVSGTVTGAFYLGAIVDESRAVPELIESNNRATGAVIGFGNGPDLVVASISGPPSASGLFPIAATVCNQGTQPSPGASLLLYASPDATITGIVENPSAADFLVSWEFVDALAPGQCSVVSASASSGLTGAFYLGAIVDELGQVPELIESNNHTTGGLIGLGNGPDLVVTSISGPASASDAFQITTTVCNQGTQSGSGSVELYASADATITSQFENRFASDLVLGSGPVDWLQPGQCETTSTAAFPPWGLTGAFYLGAIVHASTGELIESNNHTTGGLIGLGNGPDLVVASVTGPPSASGPFQITTTVCNQGTQPSFGADLRLYASADAAITGSTESPFASDAALGVRFVGSLAPGQCDTASTDAFAPGGLTGAFYLGAIVDEAHGVPELIEANNHTTGALIGLGSGPDLVIASVSGPPSASGAFQAVATVCNQGNQVSIGGDVRFYLSLDSTITGVADHPFAPDLFVGASVLDPVQPGQCIAVPHDAFVPGNLTGAFYLGAIVDEIGQVPELIESNNRAPGAPIGLGNGPDLMIASIAGPPSTSGSFQVVATVCNQGTQPSSSTDLQFYLSADSTITGMHESPFTPDVVVSGRWLPPLQPGECDATPVDAFAPLGLGTYYLGAIVDELRWVPELIESNNHATGALIVLRNE